MSYKIRYYRSFYKEFNKIPNTHQKKIKNILLKLVNNPQIRLSNTVPLKLRSKGVFRTRIGNYRLIYQINKQKKTILIVGIGTRGKVYKILSKLLK